MLIITSLAQICSCQEVREKTYRLEVDVRDPDGQAVSGVKAITGRLPAMKPGEFVASPVRIESEASDLSGHISLKFNSLPEPEGKASIYGDGYYTSTYAFVWKSIGDQGGEIREASISALLKPVKNPVPMHAAKDLRIRTPEFGVPYGFDLEMGESLPPFGKGKVADVEFVLTGSRTASSDPENEAIDFRMEIRCPNTADGFVEFMVEDTREFSMGSALASGNEAPEEGYVSPIVRTAATGKQGEISAITNHNHADEGKCYYFRVRTRKDEEGRIVAAHYGKMYGPLQIRPAFKRYGHNVSKGQGGVFIQYLYFNPNPNDRNVEFDRKRNLSPGHDVRHP